MADLPGYMRACQHTGKHAFLAILVSGGIVLQILACALYNNWWPMLTVIMYILLPTPLLFFAGSDGSSLLFESDNSWVNATKLLAAASAVGSVAILAISMLGLLAGEHWQWSSNPFSYLYQPLCATVAWMITAVYSEVLMT